MSKPKSKPITPEELEDMKAWYINDTCDVRRLLDEVERLQAQVKRWEDKEAARGNHCLDMEKQRDRFAQVIDDLWAILPHDYKQQLSLKDINRVVEAQALLKDKDEQDS